MRAETLVIGGGIIGICCALALLRKNQHVAVVTRDAPQDSTVTASCGWIAPSEILPLSMPGTLQKIPAWLLKPSGPLSIKITDVLHTVPWLVSFLRNSTRARISHISKSLAALARNSLADYEQMLHPLDLQQLVGDTPVLRLYDDKPALEAAYRETLDHEAFHGFDTAVLDNRQLRQLEPALAPDFAGALQLNDWRSVKDINTFLREISDIFVDKGGQLVRGNVIKIKKDKDLIKEATLADGRIYQAENFVIAAGAWSAGLARQIGVKLPIASVAGYQCMVKNPGVELRHGVSWMKGGFGVTPYASGLGIAGIVRFARLGSALKLIRARKIAEMATRIIPGLKLKNCELRAGWRPMCPDTLPIIDRMPGCQNAFLTCGHGQLGLTLAATTGKLIADLVCDNDSDISLHSYSVTRF